MDITEYTSYNEVRAICGLTSDDISDATLALELYGNALSLALGSVDLPDEAPGPGPLADRFLTIKAMLPAARTTKEQEIYDLTRKYATTAVALEIPLSLTAAKSLSDSKTTQVRFSPESAYQDVRDMLEDSLEAIKDDLENIVDGAADYFQYMSVVSPDTDPVTGA